MQTNSDRFLYHSPERKSYFARNGKELKQDTKFDDRETVFESDSFIPRLFKATKNSAKY
jgi:hypothetical protein